MNNMIKLPLFLGIVGASCGVVLAGVNALAAPIIEQNEIDAANAAYIKLFEKYSVDSDDITIKEVSIPEANCTTKAIIKNDKVDGVAYTCEAKGYAGPIKFQIGFANGEYHGYIDLANTESKVGIIPKLEAGVINGIDANEALLSNSTYKTAYAGTTVSAKAIAKAIEACRLDYIASLSAK